MPELNFKTIIKVIAGVFLFVVMLSSCQTVDTGTKGIEKRFGKIVGEPLSDGLHFFNPFTTHIDKFDIREKKVEGKGACNTKDTQVVEIDYTATFSAEGSKVFELYRQYGQDWIAAASVPAIVEAQIKIAIGKFDAQELVKNQSDAAHSAMEHVRDALATKNIKLGSLSFRNIDFSPQFEKAVESKVVAEQSAQEAKNKTIQIEEEAKQTIMSAKAEAESMRIKSQALSQNKGLVQFEAVRKWDGKLPINMYGNAPVPFLNLKGD